MYHYRKTRQKYKSFPKTNGCDFCHADAVETVKQTIRVRVIKNRVFYDTWDLQGVTDHLMITPKRHVASLADFTKVEKREVMELMAEYEANGYSIYARAPFIPTRSVEHQHTHLIKTDKKLVRASFYLAKPYISVVF